jgi:hypothetical protein
MNFALARSSCGKISRSAKSEDRVTAVNYTGPTGGPPSWGKSGRGASKTTECPKVAPFEAPTRIQLMIRRRVAI